MKLIIYELNEIPRRLIDFYIKNFPYSSFSKFSKEGAIINTVTKDNGELHPWSTWPSVHRGVYNKIHNIRSINQDLSFSTKYAPIWEILNKNNIDIGIFGSLQSYPPLTGKNIKFYLPDTFSPQAKAYPEDLRQFQEFNLKMTNENKAISRKISIVDIFNFSKLIKRGVISKKTAFLTTLHILKEKFNTKYKTRRSTIQNVLTFDIYFNYLNKYKPSFSTYFTNHLAGMMHRYWQDLFPMDFNNKKEVDPFHSSSIIKAMHLADKNLEKLIKFSKENNYNLWIISSMGQSAIERGDYIPELVLRDLNKIILTLGLDPKKYISLPAMQPDYCIKAKDKLALESLKKSIKEIKDPKNKNILEETYRSKSLNFHITLKRNNIFRTKRYLIFKDAKYSFEELGFELIIRDKGTAYHSPYGIFAAYGPLSSYLKKHSSNTIETTQLAPSILNFFNIKAPDYMNKKIL